MPVAGGSCYSSEQIQVPKPSKTREMEDYVCWLDNAELTRRLEMGYFDGVIPPFRAVKTPIKANGRIPTLEW